MASTCLYALPTMSGHAPDETTEVLLRDLLPDLNYGITQLLDSLWCDVALLDGMRHNASGAVCAALQRYASPPSSLTHRQTGHAGGCCRQ